MALSAPLRAGWCLASLALHGAAWMAAGHASLVSTDREYFLAAESAPELVDDTVAVEQAPTEPSPPGAPAKSVAVFPTHTHAYPVAPDHDAHPHDPSLVHVPFFAAPAVAPAAPAPARFEMRVEAKVPSAADTPAGSTSRGASGAGDVVSSAWGSDAMPMAEADVSRPARLASAPTPVYPAAAREQEIEGEVVLAIVVTSKGDVAEAQLVKGARQNKGESGFAEAALTALRTARFTPAQRDGKPVAVRMRWTVSFRLR